MENPIPVNTDTKSLKNIFNIIIWLVLFAILVIGIWWFFIKPKVDMTSLMNLISQESKKYSDAVSAQKILLAGAREIMYSPILIKQASVYAKASGMPLEQVICDNAIAIAKEFQYLPS